jgi:hypothetical protein
MPMPVNSPLGSRNTHPGVNPYINTNFVHYGKSSSNSNNTNNNIIISPSSPSSVTPSSKINHYRSNNSKSSSTKFNNTNNNNTSSISSSPSVAPSNKINHHFSNNNNFKNTNNNTNNNTNTISTSSSSHVSLEDAYKNWDPSRKGAITIATSYGPVQAFHNRGAPKISSNKKDYNGAVLKNKNDPKDKGDSYESYVQGLKSGTASDHEIAQSLLNKDTRSIQTGTQQRAAANLEGTVFLAERSRKEKAHKLFRYHLKQVAGEKRTLEEALLQDYSFAQKDHGADLGRRQLGRIDDLRHSPNKDALRKKASKSDVEIADGISDGESSTDDELREKKSLKSQQRLYSEKYDKAEKQRVAEYRKENAAKNNKKPRAKNNNKKPRANNNNNNNNNNNTLDKYMFTSQTPVNTPAKVMQSPSASLNNNNNTKPNKTLPNDTSSISNPVMANWLDTYKPQPPSSQSSSSSASKVNNQNLVYQQQGKSSSSSSSISKTTMPVSSTSRFNMNSSYSTSSSTHLPSTFLVNNPNNINNINNPGNLLFSNTLSLTGSSPQSNSAQASLFNQQGVRQFQAHSQNSSARKNSSTNNSKKEKEKD